MASSLVHRRRTSAPKGSLRVTGLALRTGQYELDPFDRPGEPAHGLPRLVVVNRTVGVRFRVARNPDHDSRLPYLVYLPIDGGVVLKARDSWPRAARVYCAQVATPWDESGELVGEAASARDEFMKRCGPARPRLNLS